MQTSGSLLPFFNLTVVYLEYKKAKSFNCCLFWNITYNGFILQRTLTLNKLCISFLYPLIYNLLLNTFRNSYFLLPFITSTLFCSTQNFFLVCTLTSPMKQQSPRKNLALQQGRTGYVQRSNTQQQSRRLQRIIKPKPVFGNRHKVVVLFLPGTILGLTQAWAACVQVKIQTSNFLEEWCFH